MGVVGNQGEMRKHSSASLMDADFSPGKSICTPSAIPQVITYTLSRDTAMSYPVWHCSPRRRAFSAVHGMAQSEYVKVRPHFPAAADGVRNGTSIQVRLSDLFQHMVPSYLPSHSGHTPRLSLHRLLLLMDRDIGTGTGKRMMKRMVLVIYQSLLDPTSSTSARTALRRMAMPMVTSQMTLRRRRMTMVTLHRRAPWILLPQQRPHPQLQVRLPMTTAIWMSTQRTIHLLTIPSLMTQTQMPRANPSSHRAIIPVCPRLLLSDPLPLPLLLDL